MDIQFIEYKKHFFQNAHYIKYSFGYFKNKRNNMLTGSPDVLVRSLMYFTKQMSYVQLNNIKDEVLKNWLRLILKYN